MCILVIIKKQRTKEAACLNLQWPTVLTIIAAWWGRDHLNRRTGGIEAVNQKEQIAQMNQIPQKITTLLFIPW